MDRRQVSGGLPHRQPSGGSHRTGFGLESGPAGWFLAQRRGVPAFSRAPQHHPWHPFPRHRLPCRFPKKPVMQRSEGSLGPSRAEAPRGQTNRATTLIEANSSPRALLLSSRASCGRGALLNLSNERTSPTTSSGKRWIVASVSPLSSQSPKFRIINRVSFLAYSIVSISSFKDPELEYFEWMNAFNVMTKLIK